MRLAPLLLPSGPIYSLKYTDRLPPAAIRYGSYKYRLRVENNPVSVPVSSNNRAALEAAEVAYVLDVDRGTKWGRRRAALERWWAINVVRPDPRWVAMCSRAEEYPYGGSKMSWRSELDGLPWHTGDPQPVNGHWPISIAVFDRIPGDGQDFVSKGYPYGDAA